MTDPSEDQRQQWEAFQQWQAQQAPGEPRQQQVKAADATQAATNMSHAVQFIAVIVAIAVAVVLFLVITHFMEARVAYHGS